ncbi:MAG: hypothetical protein K2X38_10475 [Gemmataceae bacterium]|nr:hypothetical protein [Gemmataceae bacterium]
MSHSTHPRDRRAGSGSAPAPTGTATLSEPELSLDVDSLREELERLSAANQELLKEYGSQPEIQLPSVHDDEVSILRQENARLRRRTEELESQLAQLAQQRRQPVNADEAWEERQREYEALLDEKSEAIRTLHLQLQEVRQAESIDPDELHRMRDQLEADRLRLQEDEQSLMEQARNLEMSMARDRADLARQRSELQRLQQEWAREMEIAMRDDGLRERLAHMQRRHDSNAARPGTMPSIPGAARPGTMSNLQRPGTSPVVGDKAQENGQDKPGFLRRMFG